MIISVPSIRICNPNTLIIRIFNPFFLLFLNEAVSKVKKIKHNGRKGFSQSTQNTEY